MNVDKLIPEIYFSDKDGRMYNTSIIIIVFTLIRSGGSRLVDRCRLFGHTRCAVSRLIQLSITVNDVISTFDQVTVLIIYIYWYSLLFFHLYYVPSNVLLYTGCFKFYV